MSLPRRLGLLFVLLVSISSINVGFARAAFAAQLVANNAFDEGNQLVDVAFAQSDLTQREKLLSQAIIAYGKAISESSNNVDVYINRGATYYHLKQYKEAIADQSNALVLQPTSVDALQNRAIAYEQLGELRKTLLDLETMLPSLNLAVRDELQVDTGKDNPKSKRRNSLIQKIQELRKQLGKSGLTSEELASLPPTTSVPDQVSPQPNGYISGTWYGRDKRHNYNQNGAFYVNAAGWACGPYTGKSNVENIVYFTLDSGVIDRKVYAYVYIPPSPSYYWQEQSYYHNYTAATGWTTPPGTSYNYYMLFPERYVCAGNSSPANYFKITGRYYV